MTIWEFLKELEFFYRYSGNDDDKNKVFSSYVENLEGLCILNKEDYDWKKVLQAIQRGYKFKGFPSIADIINFMPEGKIEKVYQECADENMLIVITLPNGVLYPFTVSSTGKNKETIINEINNKYGSCDVKIYPKGSMVIGDEVVTPDTDFSQLRIAKFHEFMPQSI